MVTSCPTAFSMSLAGRQEVEIEILLDDADVAGRQRHRLRPYLRRHILEFNALPAVLDVDLALVLHQRQIVGINRDRQGSVGGHRRRVHDQPQQPSEPRRRARISHPSDHQRIDTRTRSPWRSLPSSS